MRRLGDDLSVRGELQIGKIYGGVEPQLAR